MKGIVTAPRLHFHPPMHSMREQEHNAAKILMAKDDFAGAAISLKRALDDYGPHILLRIDLACCHYMLNDYRSFDRALGETLSEFFKVKLRLCQNSHQRAALGLGKILEESGQVAQALDLYRTAMEETESTPIQEKILAQLVRLEGELAITKNLSSRYIACEQIRAHDQNKEIDLQNALMVTDFLLFGRPAAQERLTSMLSYQSMSQSDRHFLIFNFLFEAMRRNEKVDAFILERANYFQATAFEKAVWDVWLWRNGETTLQPLSLKRAEDMSLMCGIRYLFLLQGMSSSVEIAEAAKKKLLFYVQNLPYASGRLISSAFPIVSVAEGEIRVLEGKLQFQEKTIDFGRAASSIELLKCFAGRQSLPVQEAVRVVYQSEVSVDTLDRLRMCIARFNRKVQVPLATKHVLALDKSTLSINPLFKVKIG